MGVVEEVNFTNDPGSHFHVWKHAGRAGFGQVGKIAPGANLAESDGTASERKEISKHMAKVDSYIKLQIPAECNTCAAGRSALGQKGIDMISASNSTPNSRPGRYDHPRSHHGIYGQSFSL